jgi:hypothetical protein
MDEIFRHGQLSQRMRVAGKTVPDKDPRPPPGTLRGSAPGRTWLVTAVPDHHIYSYSVQL